MQYLSIDSILFIVFLGVNLLIGILTGRRVKTLRDYSVGEKNFSTSTITATIVATWVGGGFMFYALSKTYTNGLHFVIAVAGASIGLLLTGQVLAVRMGEFLNNLSVAEAMGTLYGPIVRIITAISGILLGIGGIAIQFQVISKILSLIFKIEGGEVIITAAVIVIIYSAFGGIRSVTITDIFQFITFSIFIPILALVVWNSIKEPSQVAHTLATNPKFNFSSVVSWNNIDFWATIGLMLYFAIPGINPPAFQRIAMAKELRQVRQSFTYAAGLSFLVYMSTVFIAILLLAVNDKLEPNKLVNYIITEYAYPGLKGLIAVGISSMAMSTADSELNASAVLAINDIIKPLWPTWRESITIVRIISVVIGICALVLALRTTDLLELLLLSGSFYMPIVTIPLLLAIFGFRSSSRAVVIGMLAGFMTVIIWGKYFAYTGINSVIPGMVANLLFFIGSHYILKEQGGWIGIKDKGPLLAARQRRREAWKSFIKNLKTTKLYDYLKGNLPVYELFYTLFGIYVMGATYASFYTIPENIVVHYKILYDAIAHSVLIGMAMVITYPAWPPTFKAKWFITFAWPIGIFYILFVVGSMLVIMSGFHEVQVMIFLLNLVIAALLLSWPLMLSLATLGTLIGYLVFKFYYGSIYSTGIAESGQFKFIYGILLFSSFLIALFRFKQAKANLEAKNSYLLTLYEDKNKEWAQILDYRQELLKELNDEEIKLFDKTAATYLSQAIYRLTDYLRLEISEIDIEEMVTEVKHILQWKDLAAIPQLIIQKNTQVNKIQVDPVKIEQLLVNSIDYTHQHNPANEPIIIALEDAILGHSVDQMKDYTRKLKALKITITIHKSLPPTKEIYMFDQATLVSKIDHRKGKQLLVENARIIDAHYGYGELDQDDTHVYVIPINVREVRGKVMELLREPAVADPEELRHPMSIKLEKELLDKLKATKIDVKVVDKAIDIIKRYHAGVKRKSGEPFFTHPMSVALILLGYCQDQDAVVAALLHDTVEDTPLSLAHIQAMFGRTVAFIVSKVTNLEDKLRRVSLEDHENIHRLIHYKDERVAYVKLADRLHNMRTIQGHSSLAKQKHIATETLNFFVGMAEKVGLTSVAQELQQRSLEVLSKKE